jgi:L-ascorbate metabolism protein UlaG (beta-lactamase superfamily)
MLSTDLTITYINGPTALLVMGGLAFLTDPTFDPAETEYPTSAYTLHKTTGPALAPERLPALAGILLSHDHHFDNLDHQGRVLLSKASAVYTTRAGAERLGDNAAGMAPWQSTLISLPSGGHLILTATPGRHGPPGGDRGPVIGFVLEGPQLPTVYVSGDTVWYDEVAAIRDRLLIDVACLNMGAAKVQVAGPLPLTFTAAEGVQLAKAWHNTTIVPLHFEGWGHFSEGRGEIEAAFAAAGLADRLAWCLPGQPRRFPYGTSTQ